MKEYFKNLGVLEAIKKASEEEYPGTMHEKSYDDLDIHWQNSDWILRINYKISQQYITISKRLACCVPEEKERDLHEIVNSLNSLMLSCYIYMHPKEKAVELKTGMYVLDHKFDQNAFNRLRGQIQFISYRLFPILRDFFLGKLKKGEVLTKIEDRSFVNAKIFGEDVALKKETTDLPYRINAGDLDYPLPGHTHGLSEIGMPEFIVDVRTFRDVGEWCLINGAYAFFIDPQNHEKLEFILNGQTVKVLRKELMPDSQTDGSKVYCFREAPPTHWAVKRTYKDEGIEPGMRFVQIYTEGDDTFLRPTKTRKGKKELAVS